MVKNSIQQMISKLVSWVRVTETLRWQKNCWSETVPLCSRERLLTRLTSCDFECLFLIISTSLSRERLLKHTLRCAISNAYFSSYGYIRFYLHETLKTYLTKCDFEWLFLTISTGTISFTNFSYLTHFAIDSFVYLIVA
jgi:hypothetical protein